jgi:hypothetical protein
MIKFRAEAQVKKSDFLNQLISVLAHLKDWAKRNNEDPRFLPSNIIRERLRGKGLFADASAETDPQNPVYLTAVMLLDTNGAIDVGVLAQFEDAWEYVEAKQKEREAEVHNFKHT